jgi:hypothetical protein
MCFPRVTDLFPRVGKRSDSFKWRAKWRALDGSLDGAQVSLRTVVYLYPEVFYPEVFYPDLIILILLS